MLLAYRGVEMMETWEVHGNMTLVLRMEVK